MLANHKRFNEFGFWKIRQNGLITEILVGIPDFIIFFVRRIGSKPDWVKTLPSLICKKRLPDQISVRDWWSLALPCSEQILCRPSPSICDTLWSGSLPVASYDPAKIWIRPVSRTAILIWFPFAFKVYGNRRWYIDPYIDRVQLNHQT